MYLRWVVSCMGLGEGRGGERFRLFISLRSVWVIMLTVISCCFWLPCRICDCYLCSWSISGRPAQTRACVCVIVCRLTFCRALCLRRRGWKYQPSARCWGKGGDADDYQIACFLTHLTFGRGCGGGGGGRDATRGQKLLDCFLTRLTFSYS